MAGEGNMGVHVLEQYFHWHYCYLVHRHLLESDSNIGNSFYSNTSNEGAVLSLVTSFGYGKQFFAPVTYVAGLEALVLAAASPPGAAQR